MLIKTVDELKFIIFFVSLRLVINHYHYLKLIVIDFKQLI